MPQLTAIYIRQLGAGAVEEIGGSQDRIRDAINDAFSDGKKKVPAALAGW